MQEKREREQHFESASKCYILPAVLGIDEAGLAVCTLSSANCCGRDMYVQVAAGHSTSGLSHLVAASPAHPHAQWKHLRGASLDLALHCAVPETKAKRS